MPVPAHKSFSQHVQFFELLTKFYSGEQIKNGWRLVGRTVWTVKKYHTELFIFNYALQHFKAYCAIWVRHSNFRHQASQRVSLRESTQRRKVELWARNVREFCLNSDCHVTFRDLLHTDGFTSPPRKARWGFFRPKNPTASAGCEPAN